MVALGKQYTEIPVRTVEVLPQEDLVNHPSHYTYGKIECIDFIEDKSLNFSLGNAVKYIVRAGHKDNAIQDLEKAVWYTQREIQRLKKEQEDSHADQ